MAMGARLGEIGRPSKAIGAFLRWLLRPLVRVAFRPTIEGLENLPEKGAFLLVANHGPAIAVADILSFAVLWFERFGTGRPLAGFAHPFAFRIWPISWFMRGFGAVPSTYAAGEAALARGVPLLVFPGGDHEASISIFRRDPVDFGGRTGFLELARRANVPIVPMGIRGGRFTAPVLGRSRALAWFCVAPRLFGVKRYPLTLAALAGAVAIVLGAEDLGALRFLCAWAWVATPFSLMPWIPWRIHARIGPPVPIEELVGESLARGRDRVEALVRELVTGR